MGAINVLLKIKSTTCGPDEVAQLDSITNLDEVSRELCDKVVNWTVVRGTKTTFQTKELQSDMKIWHHFICTRLVPTTHLTEVTRRGHSSFYGIKKGLSINVGH